MKKLYIDAHPAPRLYLDTPDAPELVLKANYTKRTGSPGNYKYEYSGGPTEGRPSQFGKPEFSGPKPLSPEEKKRSERWAKEDAEREKNKPKKSRFADLFNSNNPDLYLEVDKSNESREPASGQFFNNGTFKAVQEDLDDKVAELMLELPGEELKKDE